MTKFLLGWIGIALSLGLIWLIVWAIDNKDLKRFYRSFDDQD